MINRKLNIAIVLPTIISKNGTTKQSLELAKILLKRGHNVSFFSFAYLKGSSFPEFEKFNIYFCTNINKSIIYRFIKNISTLEKLYLYLGLMFISNFRKLFKNKEIDILNPHDWFGIWVTGGLDIQGTLIIANINDVPNRLNGNSLEKFKLIMDRKYVKKLSGIIVLDSNNKKRTKEWLKINANKITVIRSGIDVNKYKNFKDKFDLKNHLGINRKSILFVCANLLAPNRRYEDVLYALKTLNNKLIHLIILSKMDFDIQYANYLNKIIKDNNLTENVHFIDKFFTDEERMKYIKNCDILVFPNSPQTWGLTALEAMALGLPAIVSSGSGVSEVLTDGENAIVYQAGNVDMLTEKITKYLNNEKELKKIAKNGQKYILDTFSWDKFTEDIEKIMMQSLKKKT